AMWREGAASVVDESVDLLPLLADERHDVEIAIAVDVADLRVDGPREVLQHVAGKAPAALVLHPPRLALVVTELRHGKVEVAIAVEIAGTDVGDACHLIDEHALRETLMAVVLEHDHRADPGV